MAFPPTIQNENPFYIFNGYTNYWYMYIKYFNFMK